MSMTSHFSTTHTSLLPLPRPMSQQRHPDNPQMSSYAPPETFDAILRRGLDTAISMVQSYATMISLNPLVTKYVELQHDNPDHAGKFVNVERHANDFNIQCDVNKPGAGFTHFEITDKFSMLFGMASKQMVYRACFRDLPPTQLLPDTPDQPGLVRSNGIETISDPGSGVRLHAFWRVSYDRKDPGRLVLTEEVKCHCNMLVSWYVKSQLESSHEKLHKEFGRQFVDTMVEETPKSGVGRTASWNTREERRKFKDRERMLQEVAISPISSI